MAKDTWSGIYTRAKKDAFAEMLCDIIKYIPRGVRHDSRFNKIRKFFYKLSGVKIGARSYIYPDVTIIIPSKIKIGCDSFINFGGLLSAYGGITIGDSVSIGYNCSIITESHDFDSIDYNIIVKPVIIEDNVWIGSNATILPGVKIAESSVIAAGAVVTSDTEKNFIYGGIPAKKIKQRTI